VSTLRGIVVYLATGTGRRAGTNDALYVGVSGTAGGREFPLDTALFDDFERRSRVRYALGEIWEESALTGARVPKMSKADWNDPAYFHVEMRGIDRVYLRKQCGRRKGDDDAYQLDEIEVALYGDAGEKRTFRSASAIWLGLEYGAQVWLPEVEPGSFTVSRRV
jgi:hypothetical protein